MVWSVEMSMNHTSVPANWPLDVRYTSQLEWSTEFPYELRSEYKTEYNMNDLVYIHSDNERRSVRARCDMPVGAFLGDAIGTVVREEEMNTEGDVLALYLCSTPALGNLYLDLTHNSNETRYITLSKKNYNIRYHRAFISGTLRVLIEIVEPIAAGEEIVAEWLSRDKVCGTNMTLNSPLRYEVSLSASFSETEADLFKETVATWGLVAEIREITDPNHICCGQRGLFAVTDLRAGSCVGEYTGHVLYSVARQHVQTYYMLDYDNIYAQYSGHVVIDASHIGNEARYINDYKQIRSAPNVSFNKVWLSDQLTAVVVTLAPIRAGEELVASYGNTYWRYT